MPKEKVLIVDDEQLIRWSLKEALAGWGYTPLEAGTLAAATQAVEQEAPAAVLLDINLPDGSGLDLLKEIKQHNQQPVVIMITANVMIEDTLAALRGGAYDFIGKPINLNELQITLRNGLEANRLREEVSQIRRTRSQKFNFEQIIGESAPMIRMIALARKVAESEVSSVLLQGESGTGKDLVAKAIHYTSRRMSAPFIAINCAAIPATLIESELFGFEKGAFTDARTRKEGLLEQADGGTIFLDEIGELELGLQAKLLRVLEEGTFRRVGGLRDLPLNVRIIAASNRDLKAGSEANAFRLDLYYRLSVIQIDLPPLRERSTDVLLLTERFLTTFNEKLRKRVKGLLPEVAALFCQYHWPGNVRELRNVIERVLILEDHEWVTTEWLPRGLTQEDFTTFRARAGHAPPSASAAVTPQWSLPTLPSLPQTAYSAVVATPPTREASAAFSGEPASGMIAMPEGTASAAPPQDAAARLRQAFPLPEGGVELEAVELSLVSQAIQRSGGNQTRAAELLGISRDQLRYRLKKLEEQLAQTQVNA